MRLNLHSKPICALLAAAVLCAIVMPIAFAGAASGPQATASGSVKKQVKKLKRHVNQLRQQVEDVSKQAGAQGPAGPQGPEGPSTGPAGGDLAGTYPNPLIGPNTVGSEEIAAKQVNGDHILASVVEDVHLHSNSVGASELKATKVIAVVGNGVAVTAGNPNTAQVDCPPSHPLLLAGGHAWQDEEANSIISSAPWELHPDNTWLVTGMVASGSNTLYAWATCMGD